MVVGKAPASRLRPPANQPLQLVDAVDDVSQMG
jgi:hypothetical protein